MENKEITFSVNDDIFERAKKMLRFAGIVNCGGIYPHVAEAIAIYQKLDKQNQQEVTND